MNLQFDIPNVKASIIKVFGVGGSGNNAVNHMYKQGIKGVDFLICNTDSQALEMSPVPVKIQIGNNLTDGRGAGSDPEVGKKAAMESSEELKKVLMNNTKMIFITAGMGGGTGTGAAPVIAKIAKDLGILTVGIVTKPFEFEGPRRKAKADEGIENLKKHVDTLLVIDNEKLREMYGNFPFSAAFAHADDILTMAARGIAEIITVPGYINVDFEDVKTVMANSGVAIMGSAVAEGDDRARRAVENALHSPLLSENDIEGADHILLNITSGSQEVLLDEITVITNYIQEVAGIGADMIWGHCYDESLGEKIMVTLIATGFEGSKKKAVKEENKIVLDLNTEESKPVIAPEPVPAASIARSFIQESLWPVENKMEPFLKDPLMEELDEDDMKKKQEKTFRRLRSNTDALKTTQGLDELEREPAFKRKKVRLNNVPHSSESNISRYTLTDEPEETISIKPKNSFLHDNVD